MSTTTKMNGKPESDSVLVTETKAVEFDEFSLYERMAESIRSSVRTGAELTRALKIEGARVEEFEQQLADKYDDVERVLIDSTSKELVNKVTVRDGKLCKLQTVVYKLDAMQVYLALSTKLPTSWIRDGEGFDTPAHRQFAGRICTALLAAYGVFAQEVAGIVCSSAERRLAAKAYAAAMVSLDKSGKERHTPIGLELKSEGGTTVGSARAAIVAKLRGRFSR